MSQDKNTYEPTRKDIEDLFKYLENISVKLNRINTHLVFYTIVLILGIIVTLLF